MKVFLNGSDGQHRVGTHRHYLPKAAGADADSAMPVVVFRGGIADIDDRNVLGQLIEAPKNRPGATPIAAKEKQEAWGLGRLGKEPSYFYGPSGEKLYVSEQPVEQVGTSQPPQQSMQPSTALAVAADPIKK